MLKKLSIIFACALTLSCNGVFYQPSKEELFRINRDVLYYEDFYYQNSVGNTLHGRYFPAANDSGLIEKDSVKGLFVQFHGNAQNLTTHFIGLIWVIERGYDLVVFDYSGYGNSEGFPERRQLVDDGLVTLEHIWQNYPASHKEFYAVGQSLGGAVLTPTLAEWDKSDSVDLIVIDASFHSYRSIANSVLSRQWWTWWMQPLTWVLVSDAYAPEDYYNEIKDMPMIVTHCKEDKVIPFEFGEAVYSKSKSNKKFLPFEGCRHIDAISRHRKENQNLLFDTIDSLALKK